MASSKVLTPQLASGDLGHIPDGGLQAWLQVAGSFALFFNSWGIVNSFGVYQTYYETNLLANKSPDQISWIGSTQSLFLLFIGVIAGPLYDKGYLRALLATGSTLVTLGFMFTSLSTEYWHLFLSQAACVGIGAGLLVIPSLALIPQYFSEKRAIATGIVTSGSSLGGVIYPLIFQGLSTKVGFAWATRTIGFVVLTTCGLALSVMRPRGRPSTTRSLLDLGAFREISYLLYCGSMFFSYVGFFGPIFYLQSFALSHGLSDGSLAFYLVAILNAASIPGRLLPSYLASIIGPITAMASAALVCSIVCFCWIAVHTAAGNVVFAVMYGFASGGIISMPAVVLASLTTDMSRLGTRMGMAAVINGIGSLCGSPVAGVILKSSGNYLGVQVFCGLSIAATTVLLIILWLLQSRKQNLIKV